MDLRECIRCNKLLDLNMFRKIGRDSRWYTNKCKICLNKEKRARRLKNIDEENKKQREYRSKNKEKTKIWARNTYLNNHDKHRIRQKNRDYIRKSKDCNIGFFTKDEWENRLIEFNFSCAYCYRNECELNKKLTIDHIIPISKGGLNIIENIVPSCFSCNSSKGSKDVDEYLVRVNPNKVFFMPPWEYDDYCESLIDVRSLQGIFK
jgi:5-methylcytosine-specific restriction endonuclease McrA